MAELPPHDPSTQAGAHARAPATPPSSVRPGASGERLPEGTQLGHFTIRRLIGTGGMGRVYQAQQESPRRAVAIKVMNQGLGSATALRRFEFEAQVLARLKHPGIAQIHEAGSHDFGDGSVPWFAMEYIANAKPVTDYALDAKLGLRERLKLFRQACEAVAHGHQRGVIHRDLKPSNLLVDGAGLLKVIDFGVARSTDSDMAAATLQTDVGQLVGTVQYMSPEQFDADPNDLDIRSDVYALGVVLYELLAGRLPYDLRKKPIHEAARIVREEDAPRIASLPTELHIVLNKALAKDRTQRYGSAAELSQDIERWLDGEPIAARAPGLIASVRRLVRRHRVLSAAVASAFVVMTVALTALVQQNQELQREKTAAIEARAEAEQKTKAAEDALAAKRQAEDSASKDRRAKLAEAYAATIVRGTASLSEGDGDGVQAALAAVTKLQQEGLVDPSRRIEMRLLRAAPAAEVREVKLGAGRPVSIQRDPIGASVIVLAERGIVLADGGDLATQPPLGVTGANAAAFRPDGQRLAVALNDGTVLLVQAPPKRTDGSQDWKAAFSVARRLAGHTAAVRAVAWSADGTRLASGDAAGAVRVWDGADGAPVRTIVTGDRACRALLFGREGAWLLAATADNRLQRWNLATGAALAPAVDLGRPVATIATDEAAGVLAIAFEDASVETWDAAKTMRTASTRASAVPRALAIGASKIVAATEAGAETLDASGGKPVRVPGLPKDCVALQLDGRTVLAASARGGLLAAPLEAARTTEAFATACTRLASACALPGLAPLVAFAGDGSPVEIWDTLDATRLATLKPDGAAPTLVARSDDGLLVAGAGKDGRVQLWSAITGERLPPLKSDGTPIHALAFAPSGRMLVAGDRAGRILRWELPSGTPLAPVGGGAAITSVAFRPAQGEPLLATGSTDGTVSLRDLQSGQIVRELPGGPATDLAGKPVEVRALAFSPDGCTLAAALASGSLRLWAGTDGDASNATLGAPINAHRDSITSLAFDPVGGSTLVTASTDGSVRLWAVGAGARELAKLEPGIGPLAAVVIDGDASTLVCAGTGGRVALWRTQGPLALSKSRAAVTNALDARRTAVQDWYSKGGPANAFAEFDRARAGLDPSQVHALRDLMLRFGPCGAK